MEHYIHLLKCDWNMAITFNRHLTPLKITRLSNSRKNCKSCAFNVSQALMSAKSLWWSSYQKSFLDLGFWYCICQLNQYISTNIETPMLSTSSYLSALSHFSCLLSLSPSIGLMFWKKIWDDRGIHLYSGSLICPQPFNIGTERSEAYLRLIRKTRKSGYQPANIIW